MSTAATNLDRPMVLVAQNPPRMLHRTDCWHPPVTALWRRPKAQEVRTLPVCFHCARKEAS